jgi:phytanoyl-CoA hydroxylase
LNLQLVERLASRFEPLFGGDFDTGVYPDEWYGRTGMSVPNMTKEICNGWKSDSTIASVVLSSHLHAIAAQLHGWSSSRIAQDDLISKPHSGGTAVQFHRDGSYISDQFTPRESNSITIWLPLDDVSLESGTIEYLPGSHTWPEPSNSTPASFHSPTASSCHRTNFAASLREAGDAQLAAAAATAEYRFVEIPRGGAVFHHQRVFHGSGLNQTTQRMRRALVVHTLRGDCTFETQRRRPSYIYGRYQLREQSQQQQLPESFFPLCWSAGEAAQRSPWLGSYCHDLSLDELLALEPEGQPTDEQRPGIASGQEGSY